MNNKLIFIIAFMAILTGMYGVFDLVVSSKNEIASIPSENESDTYITLWQTTRRFEKGQPVSSSGIERVSLEINEARELGVTSDVNLDFDPTTLFNQNVEKNEWVFPEMLSIKGSAEYLQLLTREGMTLYPLVVSTKNLLAIISSQVIISTLLLLVRREVIFLIVSNH